MNHSEIFSGASTDLFFYRTVEFYVVSRIQARLLIDFERGKKRYLSMILKGLGPRVSGT